MSNPTLDRAAETVAAMRHEPHLRALSSLERQIADATLAVAPDLDPRTIGAAWMILAEQFSGLVAQAHGNIAPELLVNLAQLAGQRLYVGTDALREVPCPHVYDSGAACSFKAKAATDDVIDAQMQTHYATYHPTLTWVPLDEQQVPPDFATAGLVALDDFRASEGLPTARPSLANRPDGA